uniref:RNase H type-1 domain-containing protein n=1 Tax=Brassica campestris TaxID=3711 RepID=M4EUN1_BRACM
MFFLRASKDSAEALTKVLKLYEEASGQSINANKSSITFSRKTPAALKTVVHDTLSIQKEGGVGKYLGLPEHFGRKKCDLFSSIIDRIKQKAKGWSNRFLSTAGKMTMLKSVLSLVPSHAMSCFQLPVSLCKRIQSTLTRFWWDDSMGRKKMSWIAWNKLIRPKDQGGLDFRDIQSFNEAYLAKLAWRIINNPDKLIGRILLGKYCHNEPFLAVDVKVEISHGWRGVLIGRDIVMSNASWEVGNGESINIWTKPWLSCEVQESPMGPAPLQYLNLTVSDFFLPNSREWNVDMIRLVLPMEEQKILAIKPSVTGAPDKLSWLGAKSGSYTTKSGYATALSTRTDPMDTSIADQSFDWKKAVWTLKTSPKTKLFVWKALHGAIPAGEALRARQINVDGKCKRCNLPETIDHLFFHCPFAKQVWTSAPVFPSIEYNGSIVLRNQWINLISRKNLPPTGVEGQLAPWILWGIWTARNNLVFNDKLTSATETLSKAISLAREWGTCQTISSPLPAVPPTQAHASPNCIVVKSDAAWNETLNVAGLGWVMEGQNRTSSFSLPAHHVRTPLAAEALALREAIWKCRELGFTRIRCESDSAVLVKALKEDTFLTGLYGILIDIQALASSFECISFNWISRKKNVEADVLAKQILSVELALMASPTLV